MRAINLIPPDERRDAGGTAGRSGGAAYILLGGLAVFVVLAALVALAGRSVDDKKSKLQQVTAAATASQARATQYASFQSFATMAAARRSTVISLASSRFDWAHAVHELSRTVPDDVWLTGLLGTVTPGVQVADAFTPPTSALRADEPGSPAVEMVGCTTDMDAVARMMVRMRLIDAVQRVSLQASTKQEPSGTEAGSKAQSASAGGIVDASDCRYQSIRYPQFSVVVFFDPTVGAVPTTTGDVPAGATGASGTSGATASATAIPTSFQETK